MGIAHSKVPHSTWEPLGKTDFFFDWSVYSYDKKNGLKYQIFIDNRIGKWTKVPLCLGIPSVINSLGLIKLRPSLPQRDNPCWDQSALVIRTNLSTVWSKFWLQNYDQRKNIIFDNVVTIFFRLQRKLEEKNYLFKNSCPEEIPPSVLQTRALWITYLNHL